MSRFLKSTFTVASIFSLTMAYAHWAQARTVTLPEAIALSLEQSPELQKSDSEKKEAAARFSRYRGSLFPEISLRAASDTLRDSTVARNNSSGGQADTRKTYTAAVDVVQPLYAGGALTGGLRLGRALQKGAEQNYFTTRQNVIRDVVESFYGLAEAQDSLVAARENYKILDAYSKITGRYEKIGRSREIDRIQATVNVSLSAMDIQDAEQKRKESEAKLKRLLGLEDDTAIEPEFTVTVQPLAPITVDEAMAVAEANNPALQAAQIKLDAVKAANQLDLAPDLPRLSLTGSTGFRSPDRENFLEDNSEFYSIGIELKVPLFSGLTSLAKRREHRESYYQAERDLRILQRQTREKLETALADAKKLYQQLIDVQDVVRRSRRALDLANSGYNRGIVSSQDVVQFQRSRYEAEKLLISAQYNYLRAVLDLREQLGTDLESIYASK